MASPADVPVLIRQLDGVNIADDPSHIGISFLQKADNWIPDVTFRMAKRKGTVLFSGISGSPVATRVDAMLRTYDEVGSRYLFVAVVDDFGTGRIFVSVNDGFFTQVGPDFVTGAFKHYGFSVLGSKVYVGNGVDDIRSIALPSLTTTILGPLAMLNDAGGTTVTQPVDATTKLQTGTYSFVWAVYDETNKVWVAVGNSTGDMVHTVTLTGTGNSLGFTAPSAVLPAGQKYHLFVTFPDAPIETAWDQAPKGFDAGDPFTMRDVVFNSTPVPIAEVARRGNILVAHRGRIWFAGDEQKPSRLFATSPVVPGLEQAIFDQGDFFPWDAEEPVGEGDGDVITGLAVAALTSTQKSPTSPLAIFKQNSTWLFLGDITGDPSSGLVQISGQVGCIAPKTVVSTRWGVIFCGRDSVYLLPASLTEPLDIGWPIAPAIRDIGRDMVDKAFAFYQDGFYKLVIAPEGAVANTTMWTLDIRRGPGAPRSAGPVPSWWGPHTIPPWESAAIGTHDPDRIDKGFIGFNEVVVTNEEPTATDSDGFNPPVTIVSIGKTAALDGGQPLQDKNFQRFRATGRTQHATTMEVCLLVDEAPAECRTGRFEGGGSLTKSLWNFSLWNDALWVGPTSFLVTLVDADGEDPLATGDDGVVFGAVDGVGRPRGRQGEVVFTHSEAVQLTLRDLELRYLPSDRPVR